MAQLMLVTGKCFREINSNMDMEKLYSQDTLEKAQKVMKETGKKIKCTGLEGTYLHLVQFIMVTG